MRASQNRIARFHSKANTLLEFKFNELLEIEENIFYIRPVKSIITLSQLFK